MGEGYFIAGGGFEFTLHFTKCSAGRWGHFLECIYVAHPSDKSTYASYSQRLPPSGQVSRDILETSLKLFFAKHWPNL